METLNMIMSLHWMTSVPMYSTDKVNMFHNFSRVFQPKMATFSTHSVEIVKL